MLRQRYMAALDNIILWVGRGTGYTEVCMEVWRGGGAEEGRGAEI